MTTPSRGLPIVFVPSAATFSAAVMPRINAATLAPCGLDSSHHASASGMVPQLTSEMSKSWRMPVPPHVMLGESRHVVPSAETCWQWGAPEQQQ
jgi:hypothetical protein